MKLNFLWEGRVFYDPSPVAVVLQSAKLATKYGFDELIDWERRAKVWCVAAFSLYSLWEQSASSFGTCNSTKCVVARKSFQAFRHATQSYDARVCSPQSCFLFVETVGSAFAHI
jgi:hypothetical protein